MTEDNKHIMDEKLRRELLDFEVEPPKDSWEKISERIEQKPVVVTMHRRRYWIAAAAVIALLMGTGTLLLMHQSDESAPVELAGTLPNESIPTKPMAVAPESSSDTEESDLSSVQPVRAQAFRAKVAPVSHTQAKSLIAAVAEPMTESSVSVPSEADQVEVKESVQAVQNFQVVTKADESVNEDKDKTTSKAVAIDAQSKAMTMSRKEKLAQKAERPEKIKQKKPRKWSFGMGGGSLSASFSDQPMFAAYDVAASNSGYIMSNGEVDSKTHNNNNSLFLSNYHNLGSRTEKNHHRPISVGISLSRRLSDRFYLQTGLNYSYIASDWNNYGAVETKIDQKLHFIGIPLSVTYRIAEWNRLMLYASAGVMAEYNIVGHQYLSYKVDNDNTFKNTTSSRMKPLLWSAGSGVGVSYPVFKFVSAYAEIRASYYFDNGSEIETIHSEKPFNVDPQIGFRLGF